MSTLRIRHYLKQIIAQKYIVGNKRQYVNALYTLNKAFSFLFIKMKIQLIFMMSVEDYLEHSFIVIKNKQNQNFGLG